MLQKFNITTYAVALGLFGFMIFSAAPVFADPQGEFDDCKEMEKGKGKNRLSKLLCFKDLADMLVSQNESLMNNLEDEWETQRDVRTIVCNEEFTMLYDYVYPSCE